MYLPHQYNFLLGTSFLTLLTSIEALKKEKYDLAAALGTVFLTSINYWRNPIVCWREQLDVSCVRLVLFCQIYSALFSKNKKQFLLCAFFGVSSFGISKYLYHSTNDKWQAAYFHAGLHLIGNIGNMYLIYDNDNYDD